MGPKMLHIVVVMVLLHESGAVTVTSPSGVVVVTTNTKDVLQLTCSLSSSKPDNVTIEWRKYSHFVAKGYETIYDSINGVNSGMVEYSRKYKVEPSGTEYDLKIYDLDWRDGALYSCVVKTAGFYTDVRHKVELCVLVNVTLDAPDIFTEDKKETVRCDLVFGASNSFPKLPIKMSITRTNAGHTWTSVDNVLDFELQEEEIPFKAKLEIEFTANNAQNGTEMTCIAKHPKLRDWKDISKLGFLEDHTTIIVKDSVNSESETPYPAIGGQSWWIFVIIALLGLILVVLVIFTCSTCMQRNSWSKFEEELRKEREEKYAAQQAEMTSGFAGYHDYQRPETGRDLAKPKRADLAIESDSFLGEVP